MWVLKHNYLKSLLGWLNRLRRPHYCTTTFADLDPPGRKLVADAWDQQPFEPGEWGLRVVLSGYFYASHHVGHERRKQTGVKLQEYLPGAKIKTTSL